MRDNLPAPIQGPPSLNLLYGQTRIDLLLDHTMTIALRADYPGNYIPSFSYCAKNNFICRLNEIEEIKLVEYVHQSGKLIGVRAPIPSDDHVIMEPNEEKWFIVYGQQYFEVRQRRGEKEIPTISLVPKNVIGMKDKGRPAVFSDFRFTVYRNPDGKITGASLY
ncbi:uncharacterized protein LOC117170192 [Belonocnema kinseyi]|uniref:uncharacterized protein LOC117170192 n=1 Tax=Belonocnema kinseyi TaxID=2817044 RepID=UPI00143D66C9|nr:uncharacterized protein LOC117170192 [Belonocnema kinseyi]